MEMDLFGEVVVDDKEARFIERESNAVQGRAIDEGGVGHGSSELHISGVDGDGGAGGVFIGGIFSF